MKTSGILLTLLVSVWLLSGCQSQSIRGSVSGTKPPEIPERNRAAADANAQLGIGYLQNGELEIAKEKLQRALKFNPYSATAHSGLGMLYDRTNEVELAEKHYRKAVQYDSSSADVHNAYGSFLCGRQRFDEAEKELLLAANNPYFKTPEVSFTNLGICARKSGDAVKAEENFRRALEKNPNYVQALYQMSLVFVEKRNFAKAELYFDRLQGKLEETPENLWLGYQIQRGLGDSRRAAIYADALTKKFPDSPQVLEYMESRVDEKEQAK